MSNYRLARITPGYGPDEWPLSLERPNLIGRRDLVQPLPDIDLAPDHNVSRRHAQIWWEDSLWWVRDLGSKQGTIVGLQAAMRDGKARCEPGTPIRIGASSYNVLTPEWHRVRHHDLVLDFTAAARFSLALAGTGVRPVSRVVLRNWSGAASQAMNVILQIPGAGRSVIPFPRLDCGESHESAAPSFALEEAKLLAATRTKRQALRISFDARSLTGDAPDCEILAYDEWSYDPEHRLSLAAFVIPEDPSLKSLARTAVTGLSVSQEAQPCLQRLYEHLSQVWRIDYRKDPATSALQTQKLRLAGDVMWDTRRRIGEGTCIDLALVFAAALEQLKWQPLLAFVNRGSAWHALVGVWKRSRKRLTILPADAGLLIEQALWLDPNGCTSDPTQRADFALATQRAEHSLKHEPLVFALDVAAARLAGIAPLPLRRARRRIR